MFKKISLAFFFKGFGAVATFLMSIVVTRTMPIDQAGIFFLSFTIVTILLSINLSGADIASLRLISPEYKNRSWSKIQGYLFLAMLLSLFTGFVTTFLIYISSDYIVNVLWDKPEMIETIYIVSLVCILLSLVVLIASALQAIGNYLLFIAFSSILLPFLSSLVFYYFSISNAYEAIWVILYVSFFNFLLAILVWLYQTNLVYPKLPSLVPFLKVSLPLWSISILNVSISWGSHIVSAIWISTEEFALLSTAQRTSNLILFVLLAANSIIAPQFASLYSQGRLVDLKLLAQKSSKITFLMALPIMLFLIIFAENVMSIFGQQFTDAAVLLIILAVANFINVMTGSVGFLLTMSGHSNDFRNVLFVCGIVTLLSSVILVPVMGVIGAAVSTMIGIVSQNILAMLYVKKRLGFFSVKLN